MSTVTPEVKTVRTCVEVTKDAEGTWLHLEIGGKKATLSLSNSNHGPMVSDILDEWGDATSSPRASPSGADRRGRIPALGPRDAGALRGPQYRHLVDLVQQQGDGPGFGMALGAGLLGGLGSYFSYTRRLLHKLFNGNLFQQ